MRALPSPPAPLLAAVPPPPPGPRRRGKGRKTLTEWIEEHGWRARLAPWGGSARCPFRPGPAAAAWVRGAEAAARYLATWREREAAEARATGRPPRAFPPRPESLGPARPSLPLLRSIAGGYQGSAPPLDRAS